MWGSVRPPVEDVTDALLDRGGEAGIFGGGGLLSDGWIWAVLGEAGGEGGGGINDLEGDRDYSEKHQEDRSKNAG